MGIDMKTITSYHDPEVEGHLLEVRYQSNYSINVLIRAFSNNINSIDFISRGSEVFFDDLRVAVDAILSGNDENNDGLVVNVDGTHMHVTTNDMVPLMTIHRLTYLFPFKGGVYGLDDVLLSVESK